MRPGGLGMQGPGVPPGGLGTEVGVLPAVAGTLRAEVPPAGWSVPAAVGPGVRIAPDPRHSSRYASRRRNRISPAISATAA